MKKQNEEINQKQETKKCSMKEKGITLIALVVTIIVLLILAGVSIAMLTGEGGILKQAEEARYRTGRANLIEEVQMEILENMTTNEGDISIQELHDILNKYFSNVPDIEAEEWTNFPEGFPKLKATSGEYEDIEIGEIYEGKLNNAEAGTETAVPEGKDWNQEKVTPVADGEGNVIPVPKGFTYLEGTKDTGFVIKDNEENEFVWIPCSGKDGEVEYEKKNGLAKTWKEAQEGEITYKTRQYRYTEYSDWTDAGGDAISVDTYGGFYIGRYEAGVPSTADFYGSTDDKEYKIGNRNISTKKPVSKKNNPCWNFITQEDAVKVSANMYENSQSVTSQLVDSYAWDTVVEWIKTGRGAVNKIIDSTTYGNYIDNTNISLESNGLYAMHAMKTHKSNNTAVWVYATQYSVGSWKKTTINKEITQQNVDTDYNKYEWDPAHSTWDYNTYVYNERTEIATGAAEATEIKNIYDLAGNMWEWTTEIGKHNNTSTTYAVTRGGSFMDSGKDQCICYRHGDRGTTEGTDRVHFGFRVVLYIKQ